MGSCADEFLATVTEGAIHIVYVTGKLCNQAFHEMPKDSRHFAKSLIHLGIKGCD